VKFEYAPTLLLGLGLVACSGDERSVLPTPDAGRPDTGVVVVADAGEPANDAGSTTPDASEPDAGFPADSGSPDSGAPEGLTFTEDVWPVFEASGCNRVECHGAIVFPGGTVLLLPDPETSLREFERNAFVSGRPLVVPGEPEQSELFIHGRDANVVVGDLSLEGLGVIREWIEDGAQPGPQLTLPPPPTPASCDIAEQRLFPAVPELCSPTCTSTTRAAIVACRTEPDPVTCQDEATAIDPTPVLAIAAGDEAFEIDCGTCLDWQTFACAFEVCPEASTDVVRCQAGVPLSNCGTAANNALSLCLQDPAFEACRVPAIEQCFAAP